jgi:hypothetical protein
MHAAAAIILVYYYPTNTTRFTCAAHCSLIAYSTEMAVVAQAYIYHRVSLLSAIALFAIHTLVACMLLVLSTVQ